MRKMGSYKKIALVFSVVVSLLLLVGGYLTLKSSAEGSDTTYLKMSLAINGLVLISIWVFLWNTFTTIASKVNNLKEGIHLLTLGDFSKRFAAASSTYELDSALQLINVLAKRLGEAVGFAQQVGKGDFNATLVPASQEDQLSASLMNMKADLERAAVVEAERKWTNEGLAKFATILRNETEDLTSMGDFLLKDLVKYLGASQGKFYSLEGEEQQDLFLELRAAYAFNRKKFASQQVYAGEGLLGQVLLEKETIFITDVPANYIKISSGLGDALPRNIVIIPLLYNGELVGALELASFKVLQSFEIDFAEKLSESIAATIARIKTNSHTRKLLRESQEQAERLQAQEELRRNLEEMMVTYEQQQQLRKELAEKVTELEQAKQEVEDIREKEKKRTEDQIITQRKQLDKIIQRYDKREAKYQEKIAELENMINGQLKA